MNYPLMFINNIISTNIYVYQSWENLDTMGVSSRTGVISAVYKTDAKDPSHSSLDAIIFIFLNISYIILHNGYFCDLKTNQLLSKKKTILHTLSTIHLTNSQLSFLWILSHRVDWDFTFSALHIFGYGNKFIHIIEFGYTNIQSKIKMNGLLI